MNFLKDMYKNANKITKLSMHGNDIGSECVIEYTMKNGQVYKCTGLEGDFSGPYKDYKHIPELTPLSFHKIIKILMKYTNSLKYLYLYSMRMALIVRSGGNSPRLVFDSFPE